MFLLRFPGSYFMQDIRSSCYFRLLVSNDTNMSVDESPTVWAEPHSVVTLRKLVGGVEVDLDVCSKPKCLSFRHFVLAVGRNELGLKKDAKDDLKYAAKELRAYSDHDDEDAALRKKVLGILVSRLAKALGNETIEEEFEGTIETPEERSMFLNQKAKFFLKLHCHEEAEMEFKKSIEMCPNRHFSLMGMGKSIRARRRAADRFQIPDLREKDVFKKKWEETHDPRAAVRLALTEMEEVRQMDRKHGLHNFDFLERWVEILQLAKVGTTSGCKANVLTRCGDIFWASPSGLNLRGEAEDLYRRALEENPSKSAAHHKLGKVLIFGGKYDEGIEHLRQAIAKVAGNVPAHLDYVSVMCYRDPDFDLDAEFEKAKDKCMAELDMMAILVSEAQYRAGKRDFDKALDLLEEASELQNKHEVPDETEYDVFPALRWKAVPSKNGELRHGDDHGRRSFDRGGGRGGRGGGYRGGRGGGPEHAGRGRGGRGGEHGRGGENGRGGHGDELRRGGRGGEHGRGGHGGGRGGGRGGDRGRGGSGGRGRGRGGGGDFGAVRSGRDPPRKTIPQLREEFMAKREGSHN